MKRFIVLTIFVAQLVYALGQDYTRDSLQAALSGATSDRERIIAMDNLSDFYFNGYAWGDLTKKDTSFRLMHQAVRLAEKNKWDEQEEQLLQKMTLLYYSSNTPEKDSIFPIAMKGLTVARSARLGSWEAIFSGLVAVGYFSSGNHADSAMVFMKRSLDMAEKNHLHDQEASLLDYFAGMYAHFKPDSARLLFGEALSIAQDNQLILQQIDILRHLANLDADSKHDTAMMWMHKALRLARENNLSKITLILLYPLVGTWSPLYEDDSVEAHFRLGVELARQIHSQHTESDFLNNYGAVHTKRGNYTTALTAYLKALDIVEQTGDRFGMASVLYNIGNLYLDVQDYKQSLPYLFRASEKTREIRDSFNFVFSLQGIGENYVKLKNVDSARIFAKKAYDFGTLYYSGHLYGGLLNNIARLYSELGDDSLAMSYFRQSFPNFNPSNEDENICESSMGMAKLFKKSGQEDSAFYYAVKAFPIAQRNNFLEYILEAGNLLADHYKTMHLTDSAFMFQGIALRAHDSLYSQEKIKALDRIDFENQLREQMLSQKLAEAKVQYQNSLRTFLLIGGLLVFFILAIGLWRKNVYKQKAYAALDAQKKIIGMQKTKVEQALEELKSMQSQLIQSEKMASLGALTAGIAHEIENPLNFVNNFSEVNVELIEEMLFELGVGHREQVIALSQSIRENEQKIILHGRRADAIVKGMLQHSRAGEGAKEPSNINALADEYLHLTYHGIRAKDKSFRAELKTDLDPSIGKINIVPQDVGRLLLNLYNNAFYATAEKLKLRHFDYEPTISVTTRRAGNKITITVSDNGIGMPQNIVDKIFQPFFTTKPTGQGTGLGLSLSYDIVKAHGGEIKVETKECEGTAFIILLPFKQ
ncbi:MAG TPA: ATP-binding protein [Puia sp.]|nr:ATP-binding protein [Puia sp.]